MPKKKSMIFYWMPLAARISMPSPTGASKNNTCKVYQKGYILHHEAITLDRQ